MFLRKTSSTSIPIRRISHQMSARIHPPIYLPSQAIFDRQLYPRFPTKNYSTKFSPNLNLNGKTTMLKVATPNCSDLQKPWVTLVMVNEIRASKPYLETMKYLGEQQQKLQAVKWEELTKDDLKTAVKTFDYKQATINFGTFVWAVLRGFVDLLGKLPTAFEAVKNSKEYELAVKILKVAWNIAKFVWKRSNEVRTVVMNSPQYITGKAYAQTMVSAGNVMFWHLLDVMLTKVKK